MINGMDAIELKIAREGRKQAKTNLKMAKIDLKKTEISLMDGDEYTLFTAIRALKYFFCVFIIMLTSFCSITETVKNHDNQQNITDCERAVTQAIHEKSIKADCSAGTINK